MNYNNLESHILGWETGASDWAEGLTDNERNRLQSALVRSTERDCEGEPDWERNSEAWKSWAYHIAANAGLNVENMDDYEWKDGYPVWFAVLKDRSDNDLNFGSFNRCQAAAKAKRCHCPLIAKTAGGDVFAIEEAE